MLPTTVFILSCFKEFFVVIIELTLERSTIPSIHSLVQGPAFSRPDFTLSPVTSKP